MVAAEFANKSQPESFENAGSGLRLSENAWGEYYADKKEQLAELEKRLPDSMSLIRDFFDMRYMMKWGLGNERREAQERWSEFAASFGREEEVTVDMLAPVLAEISQMFEELT